MLKSIACARSVALKYCGDLQLDWLPSNCSADYHEERSCTALLHHNPSIKGLRSRARTSVAQGVHGPMHPRDCHNFRRCQGARRACRSLCLICESLPACYFHPQQFANIVPCGSVRQCAPQRMSSLSLHTEILYPLKRSNYCYPHRKKVLLALPASALKCA